MDIEKYIEQLDKKERVRLRKIDIKSGKVYNKITKQLQELEKNAIDAYRTDNKSEFYIHLTKSISKLKDIQLELRKLHKLEDEKVELIWNNLDDEIKAEIISVEDVIDELDKYSNEFYANVINYVKNKFSTYFNDVD